MITKGKSRAGPRTLAAHLLNAEMNERVKVLELRGVVAKDLKGALIEMDAYALGTRCTRSMYHAAVSPAPPHLLTAEQRAEAVDALEAKLGLEGHARAVVIHEKHGREHVHIVWARVDPIALKTVPDSHNYRKHEEFSRDMERRFGHEKVQGAHAERDGQPRPNRTPSRAELRQEERTKIPVKTVRADVTSAFKASDGPESFKSALAEAGYVLARGDRRDFVVIDRAGGIHSLAKRIEDMRAAPLREFMKPLDAAKLPGAIEAQAAIFAGIPRVEPDRSPGLEAQFARGDGYVAQTQAAQRQHEKRQARLDKASLKDDVWDRIEDGEKARAKGTGSTPADDEASAAIVEAMKSNSPWKDGEGPKVIDDPLKKAPGHGHPKGR